MRETRIALCLLTLNEVSGCQHDVPLLDLDQFEQVFAIDGGSNDGTVEYLEERGVKVYQQELPGYNGAIVSAYRQNRTDAVVFFHPKGTIPPSICLEFRRFLEEGYDLIVTSRIGRDARNEEDDRFLKPRKWFVIGLALISRVLWKREGKMIWDVLHGCRAMTKIGFEAINPTPHGVSMDLEMVVRSYKLRLNRIEFPVEESRPLRATTHFPALTTGWRLLCCLGRELVNG